MAAMDCAGNILYDEIIAVARWVAQRTRAAVPTSLGGATD
jgi:hypothetical protein